MIPAPYYSGGPLADVAADFRRHLDAEGRRSWTCDPAEVRVTPDGVSVGGFPAVGFEPRGKRALLIHYGDVFPRSAPTLGRLTPATFALVWGELTGPDGRDIPATVPAPRVCTRGTPARVYAVTPASYNSAGDDAATVVEGLAEAFPSVLAGVDYDPEALRTVVVLGFDGVRVSVNIHEDPEDGGTRWEAVADDGAPVPDPLPHARPRWRSGVASTVEALVDKCRGVVGAVAPRWACIIEDEDATGRRFTIRREAPTEADAKKIAADYRRSHRGCVTRTERIA